MAKVKEIRFFHKARVMESGDQEKETVSGICQKCGFAAAGSLCALCRSRLEAEEQRTVFQHLRQKPWLRWQDLHQQAELRFIDDEVFQAIRRRYMAQIKDDLRQYAFEFAQEKPNPACLAKAQKTAHFYATMKLACAPDQLTIAAVRGALGRWRYEAIFKTKQDGK